MSKSTAPEQPSVGSAQQERSASPKLGIAVIIIVVGLFVGFQVLTSNDNHSANQSARTTYYKIDAVVTVTSDFYACSELDDLSKIRSFFSSKDNIAAARYAAQAGCDPFRTGLEAVVEDNSVWHASVCLRPHGETACRWFPAMIVNGPNNQKIGS